MTHNFCLLRYGRKDKGGKEGKREGKAEGRRRKDRRKVFKTWRILDKILFLKYLVLKSLFFMF